MAHRELIHIGDPVLLARAETIIDPTTTDIQSLAVDLVDTMQEAGGIGIAAPQIGRSVRLIIAKPISSREDVEAATPLALVNPVLAPIGDERDDDVEGCLSIPGVRGVVSRWSKVAWSAVDLDNRPIGGEAEGLFARILQHEVDHLDGVLFLSRMSDAARAEALAQASTKDEDA
jgi:peptide deformylase